MGLRTHRDKRSQVSPRDLASRAFLTVILTAGLGIAPVQAHSKKIHIDVTASVPDPQRPLMKLYRAVLSFDDGDKVSDAKLTLTASRVGRSESVGPVPFPRANEEGVYQTSLTYPAYGQWKLEFKVTEPGEGAATLTESLSPPSPTQTDLSNVRVIVPLTFDAKDALNVAARLTHILAAISWFGIIATLFAGPRIFSRETWEDALSRLAPLLPKVLGLIWVPLIVTGVYLATSNAPTRTPGVLAPDVLLRVRWGEEYLIAFIVKILMVIGAIVVGGGIGYTLRQRNGMTSERVTRMVTLDLILGLFIFADVVVIGYLHNLSHLGILK